MCASRVYALDACCAVPAKAHVHNTFLTPRSTAQAAHLVLRMVPYVAAATCSGSGRTPREVALGLALAAGSRIVDGKIRSFWASATGDGGSRWTAGASAGKGGSDNGDGYGVSCTDACANYPVDAGP